MSFVHLPYCFQSPTLSCFSVQLFQRKAMAVSEEKLDQDWCDIHDEKQHTVPCACKQFWSNRDKCVGFPVSCCCPMLELCKQWDIKENPSYSPDQALNVWCIYGQPMSVQLIADCNFWSQDADIVDSHKETAVWIISVTQVSSTLVITCQIPVFYFTHPSLGMMVDQMIKQLQAEIPCLIATSRKRMGYYVSQGMKHYLSHLTY